MNLRDKVIKALECCEERNVSCIDCPYSDNPDGCLGNVRLDALCTLRDAIPPEKRCSSSGVTWWYVCGACGVSINPNSKFCQQCGVPIKWE